jgi:hypothetical protein
LNSLTGVASWVMPNRSSKPRLDVNQLAKSIVDQSTGEAPKQDAPEKNPAAVSLGRLGGLKGGKARAERLTPEQRSAIARKAAQDRWGKKKG